MYYVYEISSLGKKYIYVGITSNLSARLKRHNSGHERTTRPYRPFKLILHEGYLTRQEAREREKFLKSGVGKEYLRRLERTGRVGLPAVTPG